MTVSPDKFAKLLIKITKKRQNWKWILLEIVIILALSIGIGVGIGFLSGNDHGVYVGLAVGGLVLVFFAVNACYSTFYKSMNKSDILSCLSQEGKDNLHQHFKYNFKLGYDSTNVSDLEQQLTEDNDKRSETIISLREFLQKKMPLVRV